MRISGYVLASFERESCFQRVRPVPLIHVRSIVSVKQEVAITHTARATMVMLVPTVPKLTNVIMLIVETMLPASIWLAISSALVVVVSLVNFANKV